MAALSTQACRDVAPGTAAVLAPASLVADLAVALDAAGVEASDPRRDGLGAPLSLLPVDLANGLEFDAVVVVEPAAIVDESPQGLRALYVALTRPTRRLTVIHTEAPPGRPPGLIATPPARRTRARPSRVPPGRVGRVGACPRCWRGRVAVN